MLEITCRSCRGVVAFSSLDDLSALRCIHCAGEIGYAAPAPGRASLLCLTGEECGLEVACEGDVSIGGAPDNSIRISGTHASQYHAVVRRGGTGYIVDDLRSALGTVVGGERFWGTPGRLLHGDTIAMGGSVLLFRHSETSPWIWRTDPFDVSEGLAEILSAVPHGDASLASRESWCFPGLSENLVSTDLEGSLRAILRAVTCAFPGDPCVIIAVDPGSGVPGVCVSESIRSRKVLPERELSRPILERVVVQRQAVLARRLASPHPAFRRELCLWDPTWLSTATVPVVVRDRVPIAIERISSRLDERDLQSLSGVAARIGLDVKGSGFLDSVSTSRASEGGG